MLLLAIFEKAKGKITEFFIIYGKAPIGYYVVHVFPIHLIAIIFAYFIYGTAAFLFNNQCLIGGIGLESPIGYIYRVPVLYTIWVFVVLTLYPFCRWYRGIKEKHRDIIFIANLNWSSLD